MWLCLMYMISPVSYIFPFCKLAWMQCMYCKCNRLGMCICVFLNENCFSSLWNWMISSYFLCVPFWKSLFSFRGGWLVGFLERWIGEGEREQWQTCFWRGTWMKYCWAVDRGIYVCHTLWCWVWVIECGNGWKGFVLLVCCICESYS